MVRYALDLVGDCKMSAQIKDINTREEVRLLLVENDIEGNKSELKEIKSDIRELRNYILGIYGIMGAAILARICGVL